MASRSRAPRAATPGGVASTPRAATPAAQSGTLYTRIETLIRDGGQIMIGTIAPIRGAAIAHDGKKTLVMLKHRSGEPLADLLHRLDAAIATAKATGKRVDEINSASSDTRYEF